MLEMSLQSPEELLWLREDEKLDAVLEDRFRLSVRLEDEGGTVVTSRDVPPIESPLFDPKIR